MSDDLVSVDEFLSSRKDFVKSGDILVKAATAPATWNAERRSATFVMSAEVEDRDRDIVFQDGLDTTEFLKNPIAFFNHNSYNFPVGTWSDVKKVPGTPKRTEGVLTLVEPGLEETADKLAKHLAGGSIRACSIGFVPKMVRKRRAPEEKQNDPFYWPGYEVLSADLCECSPCTVPSNPAALAKAAKDGDVIAREIIEDVLDNWARSPAGVLMSREAFEKAHKSAGSNRTVVVVVRAEGLDTEAVEKAVTSALTRDVTDPKPAPSPNPDPEPKPQDPDPEPAAKSRSLLRRALDLFVGPTQSEADLEALVAAEEDRRHADEELLAAKRAEMTTKLAAIDARVGTQKTAA